MEIRFSHLKLAGTKSPAHLKALLDGTEDEQSPAMSLGSAVHALLFETQPVTCYPGAVRRGKEWDTFQAANAGAAIVTKAEYAKAMAMSKAVKDHDAAMGVLDGAREVTLRWNDGGIDRRSTPDVADYDRYVTELKTCQTADPLRFQWQAIRYGYHAQLADQMAAVRACRKGNPTDAYVVAVESSAPFPVTVLKLTPRALEMGARQARLWWELVRGCVQSNQWPAYTQAIVDLDVPEDDDLQLEYGDAPLVEAA